ncbi:glycine betaine/L-proline ABC transporter ATP-binding protein [Ciceribacter sp. RN22]|uniref:quaternary amine ABC transporter ATP-binding protein n=1 Tax=Ciceribacter sp. RN22 TaxID=2954932 RepID=UPI0020923585|nr:glycine betaine/L-proline ABC transporter ATP-binding protein [Ciceribacter sp. RN22]MCO6178458.1 glycine betaine/L-proline ABC transporter ATP-binding protein [Ciceribacter sp. RN22]
MAEGRIEIRGLYKIFGPHGERYVDEVKAGLSKVGLNARYGHVLGLKDIDMTIPAGRVTVVMGLSGSGKSTLIRHINRLIEPTAGEVLCDGVDVCRMSAAELRHFRRHRTAMVFQNFALLPHRTVLENTLYGLKVQGVPRREGEPRAARWIARVGLSGYEDHYPNQLSGGMQQRVGIARALATDADILLMDEAFSALDPLIRVDMRSMLLDLQAELKKTIVFITHDLDEALALGDRIVILRDGEIVQQGSGQQIVLAPADDYVAAFVRQVNRGRVIELGAVMRPGDGTARDLALPASTRLEDAARAMTGAGRSTAAVVDADGAIVGCVDIATILAAIVTPAAAPPAAD